MTDYEYNAQVERERAEYHRRRSAEWPAYKMLCDGLAGLGRDIQEQNAQLYNAISGQKHTRKQSSVKPVPYEKVSFSDYMKAIEEYRKANAEFDKKLIKRNGFEW